MSDFVKTIVYRGIIYKHTLVGIDEEHILYGVSYIGQSRSKDAKTPEKLMHRRWKCHVRDSKSKNNDYCFQRMIKIFGEKTWKHEILHIVEEETFEECCSKLDKLEIQEIENHGGVFKNKGEKLKQTFNLASGGSGYKQYEGFVNRQKVKFKDVLKHLLEYKLDKKDLVVPLYYIDENGFKLGYEVSEIRQGKYRSFIPESREILNEIGFIWDQREYTWLNLIDRIKKYYVKNKDKVIPQHYIDETGFKLGQSVNSIIQQHNKGLANFHFYNENTLNDIGFIFNPGQVLLDRGFEKFIKAGKWYFDKYGKIGACPRTFEIPNEEDIPKDIIGFKVGEEVHKYRCNEMKFVKGNEEKYNQLLEIGYTETSTEAGVDSRGRAMESRSKNWIDRILPVLEWYYKKEGHINIKQKSENPTDLPIHLLENTNYKNIYQIICDLRKNEMVENKNDILKKLVFFKSDKEWQDHKFVLGLKWYYENEDGPFPQQSYVLSEDKLPKYMIGYPLGTMFSNRKHRNDFPNGSEILVENNKHKIRRNHYEKNPERKKQMVTKVKEAHSKLPEGFYRLRNMKSWLKRPIKVIDYESLEIIEDISPFYRVNRTYFVKPENRKSKSFNKLFYTSQYKSRDECYRAAKTYDLVCKYIQILYYKSYIKTKQLNIRPHS